MRVLLDTQAFLWFITGDRRLSSTAQTLIHDPANERLVSLASLWEMSIKACLGRLTLHEAFDVLIPREITQGGFVLLPITMPHTLAVAGLPYPRQHRDPFDRMLVAQALVEPVPIISVDQQLDQYSITRLW